MNQQNRLFNIAVAHRGVVGKDSPENSLSAFSAAIKRGLPIELDIHLTKDKKLVVFHDYTLLRMCGKLKIIELNNYSKIKDYPLKNTSHNIPLLKEVLGLIDGKMPIFIELKALFNGKELCDLLIEELKEYKGEVVVFGFDYRAIRYIKKRTNYKVMVSCFYPKFSFKGFVPDAICCNINTLQKYGKDKIKLPIVSWTIYDENQENFAKTIGGYLKNFYQ